MFESLAATTFAAVVVLAWALGSRAQMPLRVGLAFIALSVMLDAGIAPMATLAFSFSTNDPTLVYGGRALEYEYPVAWLGVSLHYLAVGTGFVVAWGTLSRREAAAAPTEGVPGSDSQLAPWFALLFGFGLLVHLVLLYLLTLNTSIGELARTRAFFSDEDLVFTSLFGYLSILAPTMKLGALGLLATGRTRGETSRALGAVLVVVAWEVLMGGRSRTLLTILAAAIIFRTNRGPFKYRTILGTAVCAGLLLVLTSVVRFSGVSATEAVQYTSQSLLFDRRIEQMAFAIRSVPSAMPWLNGASWTSSLAFVVPGLELPGVNLYEHVMADIRGRDFVDSGVGGSNYAAAAESYMNFGWWGIAIFGVLYGGIFGGLCAWAWSRRRVALFSVMVAQGLTLLLSGLDARSMGVLASVLPATIVPLAAVGALATRKLASSQMMLFSMVAAVGCLVLQRGDPGFKGAALALICVAYCCGFVVLSRLSPERQHLQGKLRLRSRPLW